MGLLFPYPYASPVMLTIGSTDANLPNAGIVVAVVEVGEPAGVFDLAEESVVGC